MTFAAAWSASSEATVALLVVGAMVLLAVSVVDLIEHRIPNAITYPSLAACVVAALAGGAWGFEQQAVAALASGLLFGLLLYVPHRVRPEAMGLGDVKLAVPLGFTIGWLQGSVPFALLAVGWTLAAASSLGLAMAAFSAGMAGRRPKRDQAIAFGPALCLASAGAVALSVF